MSADDSAFPTDGMDTYVFWACVFFMACALVSVLIHFLLARESTIAHATHAFLVIALFLCTIPFPLLVLDVNAALSAPDPTDPTEHPVNPVSSWARGWWLAIFFLTQVWAWVLLPIAQEYDQAGEFDPVGRIKTAIKNNVKMYIALGVVAGILMGYIIFLKGIHTFQGVVALCLAAANAFGLLLLVIFLSYGLSGVPRRLWHNSDPKLLLAETYRDARNVHDDLDIAKTDLTILRADVARMDPTVSDAERPHLVTILESISQLERSVALTHTGVSERGRDNPKHTNLVEVHAEVKRAVRLCRRLNYQWNVAVQLAVRLDGVVSGKESSMYWSVVRRPLLKVFAVVCVILTILVLWSELVIPFQAMKPGLRISIVEMVVLNPSTRFLGSVVFLYYMAGCAYWSIYQFRLFDIFVVVPRISDGASLCFSATFLTRLLLPLCYNFLYVADLTHTDPNSPHSVGGAPVTYSVLFGNMDVVDFLGKWFNRCIPIFIPILVVLIELKVIHKLLQWIGVEGFEVGEESILVKAQQMEEGRALISRSAGVELTDIRSARERDVEMGSPSTASAAAAPARSAPPAERGQRYAEWKAKRAVQSDEAAP